ncbi:MAG: hypothetical protein AB7G08_31885 [Hyphomicrobiaceae bacterium]
MTTPFISLRLDEKTQHALKFISEADCVDRSAFARAAIMEAVSDRLFHLGMKFGRPAFKGLDVNVVGDGAPAAGTP